MSTNSLADQPASHEGYAPVQDAQLYYRDIGQGQLILILHGGPDFDHNYLLPDLDRLSRPLRLIYTSGDCATDLASIWMLFADPSARQAALAAYATLSEATLQRAKGWAVLFGVMLLDTGLIDNPRHAAIGARTLRRVAEPM